MPIEARLDMAPADAVRFFAAKGEALSWDYTDTWRGANARAFTVAKATSLDVLRTIRSEVARAVGTGQTFDAFKRALRPRLQDLGWWGRQEVLDADTGELSTVQLGSDRRLRTIYQTNVQTANMAGLYKRLSANAADRPYWRYTAVMDGRTRPAHAALHGRVWRWDDPVWEVIFPPCGWGCRCRVVAMTESEFGALGVDLERGAGSIVELEVPIGRDGQTVAVQGVRYRDAQGNEKVFRPDPGWDHNPGKEWARFDPHGFDSEASPSAPVTPQTTAVVRPLDGLPDWRAYDRPDLRAVDPAARLAAPGLLPRAPSPGLAQRMLWEALMPDGQEYRQIETPVDAVAVRRELLPQVELAAADGLDRYARFVEPTLRQPFEVWLTPYEDGNYRKRYIALFGGGSDLLVMVREGRDGSLMWEVYRDRPRDRTALNRLRIGALLFGRG